MVRTITQIQRDMRDYLPRYYEDVLIAVNVIDREAAEIAALNGAIYDVLDQFYIPTATWSLARWERIFGLSVDETKPADQRRSVILSRLRGIGTVTIDLIESVAEAYVNGDVSVTEDNAHGTVIITFISNRGIPENLADIQAALRDIIPAHLAIEFRFTYLTWDEIDGIAQSWDAWDARGLTWNQMEVLRP